MLGGQRGRREGDRGEAPPSRCDAGALCPKAQERRFSPVPRIIVPKANAPQSDRKYESCGCWK